uniref:Metalloendopeptidase n=1 Tax=Plectus sambesii TaxID=2011161 RepID=A0A914VFB0_9BILA
MHVLGFGHEQSRTDRNKYLSINWTNIPKSAWYLYSAGSDAHALLDYSIPYDYASILHYGPFDFAINKRQPTLVSTMSQFYTRANFQLSALDVVKLNAAYKCIGTKVMTDCVDYMPECRTILDEQCRSSSYVRDVCQTTCRSCRMFT